MEQRFATKVALITGAGRNVGAAIAHRLTDEGAKVAVVDLDEGRGQSVVDEIEAEHPGGARYFKADVASAADVERLVAEVVGAFGRLDVLVNNVAATDRGATVLDLEETDWDRVFDISLKSVFLVTKYGGRAMIDAGNGGVIVNIGSTSGHKARTDATAYAAAKAGVVSITHSTAAQLGQYGIRVSSVVPNKVGSPVGQDAEPEDRQRKNLIGRGAVPEDIASAVAFVASEEASFMTASEILVDGGSLNGA